MILQDMMCKYYFKGNKSYSSNYKHYKGQLGIHFIRQDSSQEHNWYIDWRNYMICIE